MSQFTYSFCMTAFHSLWQAGLLWLLYVGMSRLFLQQAPAQERKNLLFILLISQLTLSLVTFCIYIFKPGVVAAAEMTRLISNYLPSEKINLFTPYIFIAYVLIVAFKFSKTILSKQQFNKLYKAGLEKPSLDLKLFTEFMAHRFSIKRPVKLFFSNNIHSPMTFGFFKPIILLPVALVNQINLQQAETLIIHELTHIKANDYLQNWIILFIENIFFFNPFVNSICNRIRLEREKNCDASVINFQYPVLVYAQTLLQAEKLKQSIPVMALSAVSSRNQLLQRIQSFAIVKNSDQKNKGIFAPATLLMIALFFAGYGILSFTAGRKNIANVVATVSIPTNQQNIPTPIAEPGVENVSFTSNAPVSTPVLKTVTIQKTKPAVASAAIAVDENINDAISSADFIPASFSDQPITKQVIVQEEASGSKTSTMKVYTLVLDNGQWVLQPDWMATSKLVSLDSLIKQGDTSGVKILINQQ